MPEVYAEIGDLGKAEIIAKLFSQRAQHLAGLPTDTIAAGLQADCFTGVWVATTKTDEVNDSLADSAVIRLSPGDLDEAVATFLAPRWPASRHAVGHAPSGAAPFERLERVPIGVLRGVQRRPGQQRLPAHLRLAAQRYHGRRHLGANQRTYSSATASSAQVTPSAMSWRYCMTWRGRFMPSTPTTRPARP